MLGVVSTIEPSKMLSGLTDVECDGLAADDSLLEQRILRSLDAVLEAMKLEPIGDDLFRVAPPPGQAFERVFGGQLLAQALRAASATVAGKNPNSLYATFVEAGDLDADIVLAVDRVRDGRSMATRGVTVRQDGRVKLSATVSFHNNPVGPDVAGPLAVGAQPGQLPRIQDWAGKLPEERREHGRSWIERPPPVEIRMSDAPTFLGGPSAAGPRSHWMRPPRDIGDDPSLHAALLVYASDYFLVDTVFRAHPDGAGPGKFGGYSLDHAIWLHRPVSFDQWHTHTQEAVALVGERGLARGSIHDLNGRLIATTMQEVLVRPRRRV
jgi:acyl-CoA thioesterase-2